MPPVFEQSLNTKFTSCKSQESHTRRYFQSIRKVISTAIIELARDSREDKVNSADSAFILLII